MGTKRNLELAFFCLVCICFITCYHSDQIESHIYRLTHNITENNIIQSPLKDIIKEFNLIEQNLTGQWMYFPSLSDDTQDVWAASSKFPILGNIEGKQPEGMRIIKNKKTIPFKPKGVLGDETWRWVQTKHRNIQLHLHKKYKRWAKGIVFREGQSHAIDLILPDGPVKIFFRFPKVNCKGYRPDIVVSINGKRIRSFSLKHLYRLRVNSNVKLGKHRIEIRFQPPENPNFASKNNYIVLESFEVRTRNDLILYSTPSSEDKSPLKGKFTAIYYSVFSPLTQNVDPEAEKALDFYNFKENHPIKDLGITHNPYNIIMKAQLYDDTLNCLYAPPESRFRFDIVPAKNSTLEFGYGFIMDRPEDSGQSIRFKVDIEHKSTIAKQFSVDFHATEDTTFKIEQIDLNPFQGKKVKIHMSTEASDPEINQHAKGINPHSVWINPIIYRKPAENNINVILISIDTLRADHLGCYGYNRPTSQEIDKLAEDSVLFEKSFSTTSWTLPAHISLLTSLNTSTHKVNNYVSKMAPEQITLADILRNNDLFCAAITGGNYLSFKYGFDKGFEMFHEIRHGDALAVRFAEAEYIAGKSIEWLKHCHDRSFFLFIHTYQPHNPYETASDIGKTFLSKDAKWQGLQIEEMFKKSGRLNSKFSEKEKQNIIDLYDGEILYTDETLIKPLILLLKKLELYDKTMIIITSDHGEEFMDHGNWLHGMTLYNEVIHIPLIIKFPHSQNRGLRIPYICSINDIMPTVVEIIGQDPTLFNLDGRSLLPLVEGSENTDRTFYCDLTLKKLIDFTPSMYATNDGRMKIIWNKKYTPRYIEKITQDFYGEKIELYDLQNDFAEENNLAGNKDFEGLCKRLLDQILMFAESDKEASTLEMDEDLRENLRALGYIK